MTVKYISPLRVALFLTSKRQYNVTFYIRKQFKKQIPLSSSTKQKEIQIPQGSLHPPYMVLKVK